MRKKKKKRLTFFSPVINLNKNFKVPITPKKILGRKKSLYRTEQDSAIFFSFGFFDNFQSRQKTPTFETLPSEKTIKMGLGRARILTSYQDFSCERGD